MDQPDGPSSTWRSPSASRRFQAPDGRIFGLPKGADPTLRQVRKLLARPDLPVVIFDAGKVEWLEGAARQDAWVSRIEVKLDADSWPPDSYHGTRWRSDDGAQLLMFERSC